ncbi:FCD domain-containing protein [Desulfobacula sp.]|uniref:FadR/GntR family transcriptional regulator n=1 Tax=Desulfobacula sp. TaxID=2593537 RepID=UPI002625F172|nr:FCD domain-containing protein [Desulfobacula sp.]
MFKRLNQTPLYEKITNEITEAIFRGDLKPGDKLQSEHELSKTFGVSRVTIREALLSLKQHGIIQVRQGAKGGAYVKKMVMDDVAVQMGKILQMSHMTLEQLSDARSLLESVIITRMIDPSETAAYIERMEETIVQAEHHLKHGNAEKRLQSNIQFHSIISEMTQNAFIILMHKIVLNMEYDFFKQVKASTAMASRTIQEHRQITRALKNKDFQQAGNLCARHIEEIDKLISRKSKNQSLLKND